MFDVEKIRQDFPMLVNNPDLIYFDSAATSLKPKAVIDAVVDFYSRHTSNVHRGDYAIATLNNQLYDKTRQSIGKLIHCDPSQVVYVSNITHAMNQIAYGLWSTYLQKGDTVLISHVEHASNVLPWFALQTLGLNIEYLPTDVQGNIKMDELEDYFDDSVKAISLAMVTNVLGSVQPIQDIAKIAHKHGALMIVDAAQAVAHMKVDVQELDVDLMGFSGHKMLGPGGIGVLYGKKEILEKMRPIFYGGDMNARFSEDGRCILKDVPVKFEAGTPNIEGVLGLGAAAEYLLTLGMDNIQQYEMELRAYAIDKMKDIETIEIYNKDNIHGPIDFNVKGIFAQDAAGFLAYHNIAVRSGNHCAKLLHHVIGTDQTLRASFYFYNTKQEIDRFVEAVKQIDLASTVDIFF